jgi:hypothetical protein
MPFVSASSKASPLSLSTVSAPPKCDQQQTLYHPNIIKLFQVIETVDHVYIVVEDDTGWNSSSISNKPTAFMRMRPRSTQADLCVPSNTETQKGLAHRDVESNILLHA